MVTRFRPRHGLGRTVYGDVISFLGRVWESQVESFWRYGSTNNYVFEHPNFSSGRPGGKCLVGKAATSSWVILLGWTMTSLGNVSSHSSASAGRVGNICSVSAFSVAGHLRLARQLKLLLNTHPRRHTCAT